MIKVKYDKLSEAFVDYNGFYIGELRELPQEVWDALDDYSDGLEIEVDNLSDFFDNLYINSLYTADANEVDKDNCTVLYVDENNKAYCL